MTWPAGSVYLGHSYDEACWPMEAREGPYAIGTPVMVSRDSIAESIRNPALPEWFPARVCLPPPEAGNWYRWYDPFVWYETEGDLSNGGEWCTEKRSMCYSGKQFYAEHPEWEHWIIPRADWLQRLRR